MTAQGVIIERIGDSESGLPSIRAVLSALAQRGVTRLLVEGGPRVHASVVKSGMTDLLHLFRAPILLGAAGTPAIGPAWQSDLVSAPRLRLIESMSLGADLLETFTFCEIVPSGNGLL